MFGKGCAGRERSELPWITEINDWSKMKGSRGKDIKVSKLSSFSVRKLTECCENYKT